MNYYNKFKYLKQMNKLYPKKTKLIAINFLVEEDFEYLLS